MFDNTQKNPAYGMLSFNRLRGGSRKTALFGSSLAHGDTIRMTVKRGSVARELNNDFYFGEETLLIADMSLSQFAEAITAFGIGDGVPVTLRFTETDKRIDEIEFKSKVEEFEDEFKEHTDKYKQQGRDVIHRVSEIFEGGNSVKKKDKEEIIRLLNQYVMNVSSNSNFIINQFNEAMDKTICEAKLAVEAFAQNKLDSIAKDAISKSLTSEPLVLENPIEIN